MGKGKASTDQSENEFVALGSAIAAGGFGVGVGEKVYRYLKNQEPIVLQIRDSVLVENRHRVSIAVANQTIHGVYIESLQLEKPKDKKFDYLEWVKDHDHGGPGFTPMMWSERQWTPKYIPPGEDVYFAISFAQLEKSKAADSECGELKMSFSRLEKMKVESMNYTFRIRF